MASSSIGEPLVGRPTQLDPLLSFEHPSGVIDIVDTADVKPKAAIAR
jgi:hypothetical protein